MQQPLRRIATACVAAWSFAGAAHAQGSEPSSRDLTIFAAQRFWFASQSTKLLDAALVVTNPATGAAAVRAGLAEANTSTVAPITSLGMRLGRTLATVSVMPSTGFGTDSQLLDGEFRRQEVDVSVGYAALPAATVSLIYKRGTFGPSVTRSAQQLLGLVPSDGVGNAILLGISSNVPLQGAVSLYANVAYGGGRWKVEDRPGQKASYPSRYTVADFGVAWRAGGPASITLQAGYRSQILNMKGIDLPTFSATEPPQQIANRRTSAPTTTQGLIVGLSAAF